MHQKTVASALVRKPPETFCCTFIIGHPAPLGCWTRGIADRLGRAAFRADDRGAVPAASDLLTPTRREVGKSGTKMNRQRGVGPIRD